jgi:hypothetical protein
VITKPCDRIGARLSREAGSGGDVVRTKQMGEVQKLSWVRVHVVLESSPQPKGWSYSATHAGSIGKRALRLLQARSHIAMTGGKKASFNPMGPQVMVRKLPSLFLCFHARSQRHG